MTYKPPSLPPSFPPLQKDVSDLFFADTVDEAYEYLLSKLTKVGKEGGREGGKRRNVCVFVYMCPYSTH